jgi:hypothetical protein
MNRQAIRERRSIRNSLKFAELALSSELCHGIGK